MIQCAVAFLLIAGDSLSRLDRLIVTTDEVDRPSYGVYEVKARDHFPHSKFIDEFMLISTKITGKGTYYMPYCSNLLTSAEIARIITNGLTEITHQAHIGLTLDSKMESNCLNSLSSISNLGPRQKAIDISKCEENIRSVCTGPTILGLAFKGIIAVDGPYKAFAPRMADQPIVVSYDQPLDMGSLVLNGEMFVRSNTGHEEYALAWYQGHLHLFKQDWTKRGWFPVTPIGSEIRNGPLITNYVLKALPDSTSHWTEFYKSLDNIIQNYKPPKRNKNSRYDTYSQEIYNFLKSSEIHEVKLLYYYPFLEFECERYFASNNEYLYNSLGTKLRTLRHLLTWSRKVHHQKLIPFRMTCTTSSSNEKKSHESYGLDTSISRYKLDVVDDIGC